MRDRCAWLFVEYSLWVAEAADFIRVHALYRALGGDWAYRLGCRLYIH